jgi:hypothetical protein
MSDEARGCDNSSLARPSRVLTRIIMVSALAI